MCPQLFTMCSSSKMKHHSQCALFRISLVIKYEEWTKYVTKPVNFVHKLYRKFTTLQAAVSRNLKKIKIKIQDISLLPHF